jgi:hypothetical protein
MMQGFWSVPVREETAERKERGAPCKKVKVQKNSNGEEEKQRFSKNFHGELGSFDFSINTR